MTTHSPVAIKELSIDQLYVLRQSKVGHEARHVGPYKVQGTVRSCPDAFLAPSVLICEGATEVGFLRGLDAPIERGLAGPGLLAHVLVSKLPLYRQSEIYARQGVAIERSTLAGWVGGASELLSPLVDAIQKHVLAGDKLHADDTPIPVLSPGSGKTRTARLWTYVRDDRPAGEAA
jgi:transposase